MNTVLHCPHAILLTKYELHMFYETLFIEMLKVTSNISYALNFNYLDIKLKKYTKQNKNNCCYDPCLFFNNAQNYL